MGYSEQTALFNAFNLDLMAANDPDYGNGANSTVVTTRASMFLCPSDAPPNYNHKGHSLGNYRATGTNYFASVGASLEWDGNQTGGPPNGLFQHVNSNGKCIGMSDITDGSSNTIAFGEWKVGTGNLGRDAVVRHRLALLAAQWDRAEQRHAHHAPPDARREFPGVAVKVLGHVANRRSGQPLRFERLHRPDVVPGLPRLYDGARRCRPPTRSTRTARPPPRGTIIAPAMFGMASNHPGGANILLGDGAVRYLKDSTNAPVVWGLGSRNGGEIISADSF